MGAGRKKEGGELVTELARQQRRFQEIKEVDYFSSPAAGRRADGLTEAGKDSDAQGRAASQPNLRPRIFKGERG